MMFYSYRDPEPHASIETFRDTAAYIRSFCEDKSGLEKCIISTIAATEPLRTPAQQGAAADSDYFCGVTHEDLCRIRNQMRNLNCQELLNYCGIFDATAINNACCIIGSGEAAEQCGNDWKVYTL